MGLIDVWIVFTLNGCIFLAFRVSKCHIIEALGARVVGDIENLLSKEQQSQEDNDLIEGLSNNVTIHNWVED